MLKPKAFIFLAFLSAFFVPRNGKAQTADSTASNPSAVYAATVKNFYTAIGSQSHLYNGRAYDFYDPSVKGSAYFMDSNEWQTGSVVYDGFLYDNIPLRYDIVKDMVITQVYHSPLKISLVSEKVQSFDLQGAHFIYVADSASGNKIAVGFYREIYAGKSQLLVRQSKSVQTSTLSGALETYFSTLSTTYYLKKADKYYTVNSEGALLDALKDHKKELQQYSKQNKLNYKKNREATMAALAAYYDHLTR